MIQVKDPNIIPPITDSAGIELARGQLVAYNRSGDVLLGKIVGIKAVVSKIMNWNRFHNVNVNVNVQNLKDRKISNIRNNSSIAVINIDELISHHL